MILLSTNHRGVVSRRALPLLALLSACLMLLTACGLDGSSGTATEGGTHNGASTGGASEAAPVTPYDVTPLLKPSHKYLGAALAGVPRSLAALSKYTANTGKQPNVLEYYAAWGDGFDTSGVRRIYNAGALPFMAWEPFKPSLASIASGKSDAYIKTMAKDIVALNLPIAISFGHEMNGDWYSWGRTKNSAADYVRAWRHIHDVFENAGASNVIWVWSPNVINPMPNVKLKPYYPGDAYVDWAGMIGYYTLTGAKTFDTLYGPTMRQIRTFTKKPFFIAETASQEGQRRSADVDSLFTGVTDHADVIGFIWFNIPKRADWRIEISPIALAEFKKRAADSRFGFDIRKQ
ncbi:glycoside hydrolase family 26 protein [Actinacidiphila soli]|uniref:glycoside hydrolase family 26 protein n=1 Tax=Actinacidiphila soli TaxID=2487275 RepID=UPI001F0CB87E|nr:glycosyl hydrolase [Actinacidiphila soli]